MCEISRYGGIDRACVHSFLTPFRIHPCTDLLSLYARTRVANRISATTERVHGINNDRTDRGAAPTRSAISFRVSVFADRPKGRDALGVVHDP